VVACGVFHRLVILVVDGGILNKYCTIESKMAE
jgi:hypothetical protein